MIIDFRKDVNYELYTESWQQEILAFIQSYQQEKTLVVKTSGSTGQPKTITHPKEAVQNSAQATSTYFKLQKGDKALLVLSPEYIAGKMMIIRAIETKMILYCVPPTINPFEVYPNIEFNFSAMVPLQVEKYKNKITQIQKLLIGGAPIPASLEQYIIKNQLSNCFATYGMTETISHIAIQPLGNKKPSYFKCLPGITVYTSSNNCLCISAPLISNTIIETNDIAEIIDKNTFIIKGRIDTIINSGGIKFQPEEIEAKLSTEINCKYIIAGLPHQQLGTALVLIIESDTQIPDLEHLISKKLSIYERPKKIIYIPQFKLTKTLKINRKETIFLIKNNHTTFS